MSSQAFAAALVPVGEAQFGYRAETALSTYGPRFDGYGKLVGHETIAVPPAVGSGTSTGGLTWVRWLHAREAEGLLLSALETTLGGTAATALEVGEGGDGFSLVGYDNVAHANLYHGVGLNVYMASWNKGERFAGSTEDNEVLSVSWLMTAETPGYIQYQIVPRLGEEIGDEISLRVDTSIEKTSVWNVTPSFEGENHVTTAPSFRLNGQAYFVEGSQSFTAHIGDIIGLSAGALKTRNKNHPLYTGDLVVDMPRIDEYQALGLFAGVSVTVQIPPTRGIARTAGLDPTAIPEPGHFVFSDITVDEAVGMVRPLWFNVYGIDTDYSLYITDNAVSAIQLPHNLPAGQFYVGYSTGDEENLSWMLASASQLVRFPVTTRHVEIEGIPWGDLEEEDLPQSLAFGLIFASAGTQVDILALNRPELPILYDFGDLPDTGAGTGSGDYQTTAADGGPRHPLGLVLTKGMRLGASVDAEAGGLPNNLATGDDDRQLDDEDGVTIPALTAGTAATMVVNVAMAGGGAKLNAFFDWNNDGDFGDDGEVIPELAVASGNNNLSVPVPASAVIGTALGARFRLSSGGGLSATGPATDGEVEDYLVSVQSGTPAARLAYFKAVTAGEGVVELAWGTLVETGVLGFQVDRSTAGGGWQRITPEMIPATGRNLHPQTYDLADSGAVGTADLTYRLVEVELSGRENVLAVAAVEASLVVNLARTASGLEVSLRGPPNASLALETAERVAGPWTEVQMLTLDGEGAAALDLGWDDPGPARFFRLRGD